MSATEARVTEVRTALSRRTLLRAGLAAASVAAIAGCDRSGGSGVRHGEQFVASDSDQVARAEAARRPGKVREFTLAATAGVVDLGGVRPQTWSYGGQVPGAPIRVSAGEVVRATIDNTLPTETSVHWHGIALRNDMDGVAGVTQRPVESGGRFTYEFTAARPGTYWLHPHVGAQLDRGLYAPVIVDDPREPLAYDEDWIIVIDDWLDGVTGTPDDVFAELGQGMANMSHSATGHMMMGAASSLLGGDAGDVRYPHFLLNGRTASAPATFRARPGTRVRMRFINAGADTAFRVALGGHRMSVTHTDGYPVEPIETDALLIGMGERYDVVVTLGDGTFPLVAIAEGKGGVAFGVVRTGGRAAVDSTVRPVELDRRIVSYRQLRPAESARLAARAVERTHTLKLTGGMARYDWAINGRGHDPNHLEPVRSGERVRLEVVNSTTMWHPLHLHGHTFAIESTGLRKDTMIVLPGQTVSVVFDADNPGRWMLHCHNIYHAEAGMMTQLGYLA